MQANELFKKEMPAERVARLFDTLPAKISDIEWTDSYAFVNLKKPVEFNPEDPKSVELALKKAMSNLSGVCLRDLVNGECSGFYLGHQVISVDDKSIFFKVSINPHGMPGEKITKLGLKDVKARIKTLPPSLEIRADGFSAEPPALYTVTVRDLVEYLTKQSAVANLGPEYMHPIIERQQALVKLLDEL